ncbi:hypothetical protein ACTXT7_005154 [Hymenolepis weldensis]
MKDVILSQLYTNFQFGSLDGSDSLFTFLVSVLYSSEVPSKLLLFLDGEPDVKKSLRTAKSTVQNICSSNSKSADFADSAIIIETVSSEDIAARTKTKMATKKASAKNLLQSVQRGRIRTTRPLTHASVYGGTLRLYVIDFMRGHVSGEDDLCGVLRYRLKYQPRQSIPAVEFGSQDLRTSVTQSAQIVLNHQRTAAVLSKRCGGNIYDLEIGKNTNNLDQDGLICRILSYTRTACSPPVYRFRDKDGPVVQVVKFGPNSHFGESQLDVYPILKLYNGKVSSVVHTLSILKKDVVRGTLIVNFGPLEVDLRMFPPPPVVRDQPVAMGTSSSSNLRCGAHLNNGV